MGSEGKGVRARLKILSEGLQTGFKEKKRVMSFAEYLDFAEERPRAQLRSSPQFAKDCFDHWGTQDVKYAWGTQRRFKLFDCPWSERGDQLLGQEGVQNQVYRALCNFVSEGAANKLILLHGPNGSAKSTLVRCIGRGLQAYSELDEGAMYRFNWIFPKQKLARGDIGFSGGDYDIADASESYAHLPDDLIDAKFIDELRDHPLLLLPLAERRELMSDWLSAEGGQNAGEEGRFVIADYLQHGQLSHRNRGIFEALLASYKGDLLRVLRHVQVERFFISHRYREGYVTVEPQLSVDAHERQVTQDNSISALPPALQSLALFYYGGELVAGNRGLIEYSDLLKRPLEAFKYLLTTVEQSSVSLQNATLYLDLCFIGTSNEIHLSAFKEIPEFQSFKGRVELVRVPYLLELSQEQLIYEAKLREAARSRHVAPHCAYVTALWAVMTRVRKPVAGQYPKDIADVVDKLGPLEKAELYGSGKPPEGLTTAQRQALHASLADLRSESQSYPVYEGLTGASPRELQSVLFNASNAAAYDYVSPLAILAELEELCKQVSVYDFLKQEPQAGGFHDHRTLIDKVRQRLLDRVLEEFQGAMGLVDDAAYRRLFDLYLLHVTHFTKGEKIRNANTGKSEPADETMMTKVEKTLGIEGEAKDFRHSLISKIGAWSLDNPNTKPIYEEIFAGYFLTLRDSYFQEHDKAVALAVGHFLMYVSDGAASLSDEDRLQSKTILENLIGRYGYLEDSARDIIRVLARARYSK
ncbi:MAG: serine protein kinase PrkA [Myxococcales bacterium]|nr:serine protein kinase PrkA [Myxococcales bacterium]